MDDLLTVRNLCKSYNTFSLKNVNLEVPKGSIVGFIGENGAGKTTTIKAIIGAIRPEEGSIEVLGERLEEGFTQVKQDLGVVIEGSFFYGDFTPKAISKVLKGLYEKWDQAVFDGYCHKYQLPLEKKIKEFSKGMRMKLSLTIALSHHAKLLILDEPTSGLDPIVRSEILDEFLAFIQDEDHGILLSSHITTDLEKVADYICFIHDGQIIFTEEKDELIYNYGVLKVGVSQFEELDLKDFIGWQKGQYQVEALVKDKRGMQQKYPNFTIDPVSLEEIMLFHVRGMKQ